MKNPNSPINRMKKHLSERWSGEDYPGAEKRFQVMLFGKDFAIFVLLPIFSIILFKSCDASSATTKHVVHRNYSDKDQSLNEGSKSQIIDFRSQVAKSTNGIYAKRAPGTLVKVRLLNDIETYSSVPVHAQVIDTNLGKNLYGGTLIGEASPDQGVNRVNIVFHYVKDPNRPDIAVPISARALSLDGTFGIDAQKKGNIFARSALSASAYFKPDIQGQGKGDLKDMLLHALAGGFMDESNSDLQVMKNQLQVLSVEAPVEFFVELTDYFPGSNK